ncbi:MAG: penicillin-binding protein 1C [Chlamydiae bacterium]|nr:penicillin-binding protein 1C [Chlamydiota bacterium]MBI3266935.1 penicillin-binding protein 1C [Chlamydiota bacterium]
MKHYHRLIIFLTSITSLLLSGYFSFLLAVAYVPLPPHVAPPPSLWIEDAHGKALAAFVSENDEWYFPLKEKEISPYLYQAIVAIEDRRFYGHSGVDWLGVAAALWQDVKALKIVRGASTLTMQVEHLRHPKSRTFKSKWIEAIRAYQLEKKMSKKEILLEYLNRCPMGGNLMGVGAASWRYFDLSCRDLSLNQAALLAGLPQSPNRYRPDLFPERAFKRRNHVLLKMWNQKMISEKEYQRALSEPVQAVWHSLPHAAHDSALPFLLTLKEWFRQGKITTTLDSNFQEQLTLTAREVFNQVHSPDINTLAIVLLNTQTAECLASISLTKEKNVLDLSRRSYSTGSTLKPFIYAASFEMGLCTPSTLLKDQPIAWTGYTPQNYDEMFRGPITAGEALRESRNIPAMMLLSKVGIPRVLGILEGAGFKKLSQAPEKYGLSLAIGGAEASILEMAEAYATLGRGGFHVPVKFIHTSKESKNDVTPPTPLTLRGETLPFFLIPQGLENLEGSRRGYKRDLFALEKKSILSSKACWQVLNVLSDSKRTERICPEAALFHPAWKTGTSSDHKDAWCAVVTPQFTLVVWLGNTSGKGSHELVGQTLAAPLALRLLNNLHPKIQEWPSVPDEKTKSLELEKGERSLVIASIAHNQEFYIDDHASLAHQKITLKSNGGEPHSWRWWFVDGTFIGKAHSEESLFWTPRVGFHDIRVNDESGACSKVSIQVQ